MKLFHLKKHLLLSKINKIFMFIVFLPTTFTAFDGVKNFRQHSALFLPPFLYFSHKKSRMFCFYIAIMLLDHEMSSSPTWCFTSPQGQRWLGKGLTLCCHILGLPVPNNNKIYPVIILMLKNDCHSFITCTECTQQQETYFHQGSEIILRKFFKSIR